VPSGAENKRTKLLMLLKGLQKSDKVVRAVQNLRRCLWNSETGGKQNPEHTLPKGQEKGWDKKNPTEPNNRERYD